MTPLVSVCIPTYNGGSFIATALASVAAQDYPNIEVVVVDDASHDDTVAHVKGWRERPVDLVVHRRNRGHNATWNETIARAQGEYIKFLHQDDELTPDCVSRMVASLQAYPSAGIVFSRRRLRIDGLDAPTADEWVRKSRCLDSPFGPLGAVNQGSALFLRWFDAGLAGNWVAEPSAVMVRRKCLERVGLFARHVAQLTDVELWMRAMIQVDVAFIEDELATFRVGASSLTMRNRATRFAWLDRLWMLEVFARDESVVRWRPEVQDLLRAERRQAFRSAARLGRLRDGSRVPVRPYVAYATYRARSRVDHRYEPFPQLV